MNNSVILITCMLVLSVTACVQEEKPISQKNPDFGDTTISAKPGDEIIMHDADIRVLHEHEASRADQDNSARLLAEKKELVKQPIPQSRWVDTMGVLKHKSPVAAESMVGQPAWTQMEVNRDRYGQITSNAVKLVSEEPVSTFSIDVDTGSYAVVRRHINDGLLPPANAVRIEELINYFDYHYSKPLDKKAPFSIATEMVVTPWNPHTRLVQIGLQGYLPEAEERSPANLVFLVDVSGSMKSVNKLPLLKKAFRLLVNQLDQEDKITLVVYAGSSGVVLETTPGDQKGSILAALEKLDAGGSTHGSAGIKLAYEMAEQAFIQDGINRVILATDGDFNVGTVSHDALINLIEQKKARGIALTTLGFGHGNYNDHLMEQLADHGDGNYAYIDSLNEARKVLVDQASATLETIARDVKIQIEWNPALVSEYRLIGYENRLLNREDFNNDKVDAGDIGAGHNVTALYEITLNDSEQRRIEPLRYQQEPPHTESMSPTSELAYVKLRYKQPEETLSRLIQQPLSMSDIKTELSAASESLRFASSVAAFGELLRGGQSVNAFNYEDVLQLARTAKGHDVHGYRAEFIQLVEMTKLLDSRG
ncbi:MAG: VWA domain-containing protein [Gammaproteobacteria bacterium]|nr:VWA domain-containing protein [Gammaproteobacteria bacterium]